MASLPSSLTRSSDPDEGFEPSDLELLASATREALDAQAAGVLVGPALDEVALERAARRARQADAARMLRTVAAGDAA